MGVVFDRLGFMRKLEGDGGFTRNQAEVALKQDIRDVRGDLGVVIVSVLSAIKFFS